MDAHDGSEPVKQLLDMESVWMVGLVKRCWLRGPEIELPPTKNVSKGNAEYSAGMVPDKKLSLASKFNRLVQLESSAGRGPVRRLLYRYRRNI